MGSVYKRQRSRFWWVSFKDVHGRFRDVSAETEDRAKAERFLRDLERRVRAEIEAGVTEQTGPMTLSRYADRWIAERKARGVASARDDEARFRDYVRRALGEMVLADIRPRHVRELIRGLEVLKDAEGKAKLAPRTIRHVYGVLRVLMNDAVADELLDSSPCVLRARRNELPKKRDKHPRWRVTAVYTVEEVERLLSDPRIPAVRRALYALLFLTGMRISELVARRWRDLDTTARPLWKLHVHSAYVLKQGVEKPHTKTGVEREVPVHATLAKVLGEWKLKGWAEWTGRAGPSANDLIIPGPKKYRTSRARPGEFLSSTVSLEWLQTDCELLGFPRRRQHDTRRTFVSIGRGHGASKDLLTWVSHGAEGSQVDDYTTFPWEDLCEEVAKVRVSLREGKVLTLASNAGGHGGLSCTVPAPTGNERNQ